MKISGHFSGHKTTEHAEKVPLKSSKNTTVTKTSDITVNKTTVKQQRQLICTSHVKIQ